MKKLNALERIAVAEDLIDRLIKFVNHGSTRQVLFGAALDVLIEKGLITKEELSARTEQILDTLREPREEEPAELGEQVSDECETAL